MPISSPLCLSPVSQKEFAQIDYQVMRHAFECQNDLGRLCEEAIYQNDLAARLRAAGLPVQKEVPITIRHRDFAKTYALDLVVGSGGIYELKTGRGLIGEHEAQLLNYLFLCGSNHGKLINFGPAKVESRFVNTTLTQTDRTEFAVEMGAWKERSQMDQVFRDVLLSLLKDWGCGLDLTLYTEALIHFVGGVNQVAQRLPLTRGDTKLGNQRFNVLSPETAFRVTALKAETADYENHLRSLLQLSPLRTIQWVNLGRKRIQLISLSR
jgi:GxxExxY protein